MAPRFSVVMPTHNRAGLLRFAIASVLAQTEGDFELLVVGDGCTDNTAEVVTSFPDPRIRWLDLPKSSGFGYANRNVALKQAAGACIAYVTDDDLVFPDHLAMLANALETAGAEWVYGRPLWVTTEGLVLPFASDLRNPDELETYLTVRNHIPSSCVMHRRSCLDRYGYWPEDVPSSGDWRYWIRIIEGGRRQNVGYCPTPSVLHFHAGWRTTPDTQIVAAERGRAIAAGAAWWPATLKVAIAPGMVAQEVFAGLVRRDGYIEDLRRDVRRVIERLAWMQLDETLAAQRELATVYASTSWRLTAPLRALGRMIGRQGS